MLNYSNKLTVQLLLGRLIGLFPYLWNLEWYREGDTKTKFNVKVKTSLILKAWSASFTLSVVIIMLRNIMDVIVLSQEDKLTITTFHYVYLTFEVMNSVFVGTFQVLFWWNHSSLVRLVRFSMKILPKNRIKFPSFWCSFATQLLCISASVSFTVTFLCFVLIPPGEGYTGSYQSYGKLYRYVLYYCIIVLFCLFYSQNIEAITCILEEFLQPILKISGNECKKISTTKASRKKLKEVYYCSLRSSSSSHQLGGAQKSSGESTLFSIDFDSLQMNILSVYKFHRLFNNYIEKMIIFSISVLIINVLVASFYMSLWSSILLQQKILSIAHIMIAVVPLVYLGNITTCYHKAVRFNNNNNFNLLYVQVYKSD